MERLQLANDLPYEVGALYSRREDIHGRYSGQERGGISTPPNSPFVFLFTGEAGVRHGYTDRWDDDNIFHYFGEGQVGDMQYVRGNRAIRDHLRNNKRLLIFQSMGHRKPYRFWGEFEFVYTYEQDGVLDTKAIFAKQSFSNLSLSKQTSIHFRIRLPTRHNRKSIFLQQPQLN